MSETGEATTANVILVGGTGWASLWPDFERVAQTKALGYFKGWWRDVSFFHADGHLYSVATATPDRPVGSVARLLAQTVYNPWLTVRYEFERQQPYALTELKTAVSRAIELDDDILTQFHEAHELQAVLATATSFRDVAAVLELSARELAG